MEVKLDLPVHLLDRTVAFDPVTGNAKGDQYYPYCENHEYTEPAVLTRTREKVNCPRCIKQARIRQDI